MDDLIKKTIEWAENAGNLALQEMPFFVEECIKYGIWMNLIEALIGFTISAISSYYLYKIHKSEADDVKYLFISVASFLILFLVFASFCCLTEFFKAWLAPTLFILELIKK